MLKPILDIDNLNVSLTVFGLFILVYGCLSAKIQRIWYLGEALPAFVLGILFGPAVSDSIDVSDWDRDRVYHTTHKVAYDLSRLIIGVQLVKVGYELPKQYQNRRAREMTICLFPVMAVMWLCTTGCIKLMVPRISLVSALIIASCVTCTDPVLSQAIAKGPFAENYVRRPLREFISSEAGGNDGFGFPFLLFSVALLRYAGTRANAASLDDLDHAEGIPDQLGGGEMGRYGGGLATAVKHWLIEGIVFMVLLGLVYGVFVGSVCRVLLRQTLKRKWVDNESYSLFPFAIGLFIVGTCGCFGADDTLACFVAGNALNWDGQYLAETHLRHDSFNNVLERLLNFVGFMFIGLTMPWPELTFPDKVAASGLAAWRLVVLALLVLVMRRIPAIMLAYRFMPRVCRDWREALFLGYFGPIGIGAVSYVEFARQLFPDPDRSDEEINNLTRALIPVVYWLVFCSIIVHGISVPILHAAYRYFQVQPVHHGPVEILLLSDNEPLPANSTACPCRHAAVLNNRFSRADGREDELEEATEVPQAAAATQRKSRESIHIDRSRQLCFCQRSTHASDESVLLERSTTPSEQSRRDARNIV